MEALQFLQYLVLDDCDHWLNKATTLVSRHPDDTGLTSAAPRRRRRRAAAGARWRRRRRRPHEAAAEDEEGEEEEGGARPGRRAAQLLCGRRKPRGPVAIWRRAGAAPRPPPRGVARAP